MDIPRVDVLVFCFFCLDFLFEVWVLSFRVLTFFVFYSVSLDIERLGFAIRKVHFLSTVMLIGSPLVKNRPKIKCTCLHLNERPKRLQMSLPAPRWCKFRDPEAIWISQSLQQILCWWLFPLEPIRTVFPVAFPSMATVELSYRWELQKNHFMLYPNDCVLFCVGTSMLWLTLASSPSRGRTWMWAGPDTLSQSATPSMPLGGSTGYVWGFIVCLFVFLSGVWVGGGWNAECVIFYCTRAKVK